MKDIYEILRGVGLTVPDDKKEAFISDVREN